jgi:hypothetical protein
VIRVFRRSSLAFELFWRDPVLVRDLDVLVGCGHVQREAVAADADSPAGWFAHAALTYTGDDAQGVLAREACRLREARARASVKATL